MKHVLLACLLAAALPLIEVTIYDPYETQPDQDINFLMNENGRQIDIHSAKKYFEMFIKKFKRHYTSAQDKAKRYDIFVQNLILINELNKRNSGAIYGITNNTDLTEDEFECMRTGFSKYKKKDCSKIVYDPYETQSDQDINVLTNGRQIDIHSAKKYFEMFIKKFKRHYTSAQDKAKRYDIFVQNLILINELNKRNSGAIYGITNNTDLTEDEFECMRTGLSKYKKKDCSKIVL